MLCTYSTYWYHIIVKYCKVAKKVKTIARTTALYGQ